MLFLLCLKFVPIMLSLLPIMLSVLPIMLDQKLKIATGGQILQWRRKMIYYRGGANLNLECARILNVRVLRARVLRVPGTYVREYQPCINAPSRPSV